MTARQPAMEARRWSRRVIVIVVLAATLLVTWPAIADAAVTVLAQDGRAQLRQVIANLRNVLVGLLVALATLFLTVGGIRYLAADGDPGEIDRAKKSFRNAAIGYGLAALAPVVVSILQSVVG